jgi:DNA uptake protein ComE-like DNA-binding protein
MWKQFLHDYLCFTKKERTGIIVLLSIIIILQVLPFLFPLFIHEKKYDHSAFIKEMAQLKIQQEDSSRPAWKTDGQYETRDFDDGRNDEHYFRQYEKNYDNKIEGELFYFDPNTASVNDWMRLGIKEKTAQTIQKYVSKGGHFYKPEDISKIWGLHPGQVSRLLPYVRIEKQEKTFYKKDSPYAINKKRYDREKTIQNIDINLSDTTAFIALPGIGSKLAQRIINFRDRLGGFYSVDQVAETFGLPDSTFQKIRSKLILNNPAVKKININTATVDELKVHPYLRYNLANVIVQYRTQHGNFTSIAGIKKIMIFTDEIYNKVAPYLSTE